MRAFARPRLSLNGFCSEANLEGIIACMVRGHVAAGQFLLRGIGKVKAEWAVICTAHNLAELTA